MSVESYCTQRITLVAFPNHTSVQRGHSLSRCGVRSDICVHSIPRWGCAQTHGGTLFPDGGWAQTFVCLRHALRANHICYAVTTSMSHHISVLTAHAEIHSSHAYFCFAELHPHNSVKLTQHSEGDQSHWLPACYSLTSPFPWPSQQRPCFSASFTAAVHLKSNTNHDM